MDTALSLPFLDQSPHLAVEERGHTIPSFFFTRLLWLVGLAIPPSITSIAGFDQAFLIPQ